MKIRRIICRESCFGNIVAYYTFLNAMTTGTQETILSVKLARADDEQLWWWSEVSQVNDMITKDESPIINTLLEEARGHFSGC